MVSKNGTVSLPEFFSSPQKSGVPDNPPQTAHTFIDHSFRICDPKLCQLLCGASHNGRTQYTGQRNILKRIIQDPEIIQKCNNLCCGKISGSGRRIYGIPLAASTSPKVSAHPVAERSRITISPYRTGRYSPFLYPAHGHVPPWNGFFLQ